MRPTLVGWPDDVTVTSPRVEVVIGGESYPVESVTVRGELTTDLPEPIAEAPGESVPSASFVVRVPGLVLPRDPSPWLDEWIGGLWGQPCTVRMGHGDALVDVFVGQVAEVDGSTGDATIAVEVDGPGAWSRDPATVWPMSATQHHAEQPVFQVGLSPLTVLDRLARDGGWHSFPPPSDTTVLHAPMQGSLLPEVGTIGYSLGGDGGGPVFEAAPWGWGVWQTSEDVDVDMTPVASFNVGFPSRSVQMTVWADPASATEDHYWECRFEPNGYVLMYVLPEDGTLDVYSVEGDIISLPLDGLPAGPYTVRADPGLLTLTLPDGTQHSTDMPGWDGAYGRVDWLYGLGAVGPVKIDTGITSRLPDPPTLDTWTPTFLADPSLGEIEVTPWIDDRVRWDVMVEIVTAEGGALLTSGDGTLRFLNRDRLVAQPISADVGVENLAGLRWKMLASNLATSVRVGYSVIDHVVDEHASQIVATLLEGERSNTPLLRGQERELIVDFDVDAAWGLDDTLTMLTRIGERAQENGTDGAAWHEETELAILHTIGDVISAEIDFSIEQLSPMRAIVRMTWNPHFLDPGGLWPDSDFIYFTLGPFLRAHQTIVWLDDESISVDTGVTLERGSREISIPASPWRQGRLCAQEWGRVLAQQAGRQVPVIDQATIATPDPRLEVGDVVRVHDPEVTGVEARALITGNDVSYDVDSGLSQTLRLRLLPWTIDDFNQTWGGATFDDFNAVWGASATFDDFNADPLRTE